MVLHHVDHPLAAPDDERATQSVPETPTLGRGGFITRRRHRRRSVTDSTESFEHDRQSDRRLERHEDLECRSGVVRVQRCDVFDVALVTVQAGDTELPVLSPHRNFALSRSPENASAADVVIGESQVEIIPRRLQHLLAVVEQFADIALDGEVVVATGHDDGRSSERMIVDVIRTVAEGNGEAEGVLREHVVLEIRDALLVLGQFLFVIVGALVQFVDGSPQRVRRGLKFRPVDDVRTDGVVSTLGNANFDPQHRPDVIGQRPICQHSLRKTADNGVATRTT